MSALRGSEHCAAICGARSKRRQWSDLAEAREEARPIDSLSSVSSCRNRRRQGHDMRIVPILLCSLPLVACIALPPSLGTESDVPPGNAVEAPTGFDGLTNGFVDQATFNDDLVVFDDVETLADGLGPLYNAQSCRECHQNPISGGSSQVSELRVGHGGPHGKFENPEIPIAHGTEIITGRSLVNDRAICPNAAFPVTEIQQRVPDSANVRTFRVS